MGAKETLAYALGLDYLQKHREYRQRLLIENTGINKFHLPSDGDLKTAMKVNADRLRTTVAYPAVLALRITGIDAAVNIVKDRHPKKAK